MVVLITETNESIINVKGCVIGRETIHTDKEDGLMIF